MNNPNKLSAESFFSIKLEQRRNGIHQGSGTGFIYQPIGNNKTYLVTNYHVLLARYPKEPSKICSDYADSPDEIAWMGWKKNSYFRINGSFKIEGDFQFLEHPRRSEGIDLVAVPIEFPEDMVLINQNQIRHDPTIPVLVGSELFIVGYPHGYGLNMMMPIWKRGTIASEPLLNESDQPRFLIDAFTDAGMSGSPVFAVARRDMFLLEQNLAQQLTEFDYSGSSSLEIISKLDPKKMKETTFQGINLRLIGIYSGRVDIPRVSDSHLGIVYKIEALEELFKNPVIASHPFPHE